MNHFLNYTKISVKNRSYYIYEYTVKEKCSEADTIFAFTNSRENVLQCDELTLKVQIFHIVSEMINKLR